MRLYWEIGRRAFQRMVAYRTANIAGGITNAVFGYLRVAILIAVYGGHAEIAGYDLEAVITFSWVTQALLMVTMLWGWWEVEQSIRTGDVVSDLTRPYSYLGFWLARDYGRALYYLLFRGIPILLFGEITFGLDWPTAPITWLAFAASLILAIAVSFAWRFMVNLTAFWMADARGPGNLAIGVVTFLSGLIAPLPFLPPGVREVALALPFAGILQTPSDVFLGRLEGTALLNALGLQLFWAVVMLGLAQVTVAAATRRVFVQGG